MEELDRLAAIMARLRAPGGCPWDREQTHESIRRYVIEEAYEVAEAIDHGDPVELCNELGDLLLQVVFHARMAQEAGQFDLADVCRAISAKLERRHPHVFGDVTVTGVADVLSNWEAIKARERGPDSSTLDGVPRALPALQRAARIGDKAAAAGFDWRAPAAVLDKLDEERAEVAEALGTGSSARLEEEIGDLLFAAASFARLSSIDPENALRGAIDRFEERLREMESTVKREGRPLAGCSDTELEDRWQAAKRAVHARKGAFDRARPDR